MNPELLTAKQLAALLGKNPLTIRRWRAQGLIPSPIIVGESLPMWRREEIMDWIRADCPDRDRWQKLGWPPRVMMKLTDMIEATKRDVADAQLRLRELLALLEQGEAIAEARRQ